MTKEATPMKIEFEINDTSAALWASIKATDEKGNPVDANTVAKALFLQWVREKASLD